MITGLTKIMEPGMPDIDDVRSRIEFTVLNQLKGKQLLSQISGNNLAAVASQYNASLDTLYNVNLLNNFLAGLGSEPSVVGAAFGQEVGDVSAPILGRSGVYLVKTLNKSDAGQATNIAFIKRQMNSSKKNGLRIGLKEALKSFHDIKDNRSTFY